MLKNLNLFSDEQVYMGNTPEGFVPNCGSTRMDQQPGGITGANQNGDEVCFRQLIAVSVFQALDVTARLLV